MNCATYCGVKSLHVTQVGRPGLTVTDQDELDLERVGVQVFRRLLLTDVGQDVL